MKDINQNAAKSCYSLSGKFKLLLMTFNDLSDVK